MKIIFSSISRLFFSYSKFLASLFFLSSIGTFAQSNETYSYLECDDKNYRLSGTCLNSNYNIRTKKIKNIVNIYVYTDNKIIREKDITKFEI